MSNHFSIYTITNPSLPPIFLGQFQLPLWFYTETWLTVSFTIYPAWFESGKDITDNRYLIVRKFDVKPYGVPTKMTGVVK